MFVCSTQFYIYVEKNVYFVYMLIHVVPVLDFLYTNYHSINDLMIKSNGDTEIL